MTETETLLAALVLIWILWPFLIGAVIWLVGTALDRLDRLPL